MTGGGQYDQAQLAKALSALDATDFASHDRWLQLMMACHHATNGDGREEFIEWSTSDPDYADDAESIGRRWDSLHTDRDAAVKAVDKRLGLFKIQDFMTPDPVVLRRDDTLAMAIHKMAVGGFRHIPIVDDGRPVGVIAAADVFRYIVASLD